MPISIWWIRRDLRFQDNSALLAAQRSGNPVMPVFILDEKLMKPAPNRRQRFLISALNDLRQQLRRAGSDLLLRQGDVIEEWQKIMGEFAVSIIFAEEDFSHYARQRDSRVGGLFPLTLVGGLTIHHPTTVLKPDGTPYTVFTPYSREWKELPDYFVHSKPSDCLLPAELFPVSSAFPMVDPVEGFPATWREAEDRFTRFLDTRIETYTNVRDRMDLEGTSMLSPYLRFGMISPARLASDVKRINNQPASGGSQTWLNELTWRDFYQSILFHFPYVQKESFQPKFRQIAWRNAPQDLHAWKEGLTGIPVVDAAMRQLSTTGWMHNRARMITASFLTKDLLINWQEGESWFMEQLVDGDIASNNGGWQWSAGTGTDAAPYFRIFNPVLQSRKFDPNGNYIRRWVPELQNLPDEWIHEPWKMSQALQTASGVKIGQTYPSPIVDHADARIRTLAVYKSALV
jgi:deoxyribodipyrimidine photo-lyase